MSEYAIYPQEFKNLKISKMHNECFIIMSFDEKNTGVYEIIKKAAKACNIKCNRSDELTTSLPFFNKIATSILTSYYLIVDIPDLRANVLYELGIAHTLRDAANVLIIKEKGTICPSDFSYINYFRIRIKQISEVRCHP